MFGNVTELYPPTGINERITQSYDRNHQVIYKSTRDGWLTWTRNYFGRLEQHRDMSGAQHHNNYDWTDRVTGQTCDNVNQVFMVRMLQASLNAAQAAQWDLPYPNDPAHDTVVYTGFIQTPITQQNLVMTYSGGLLQSVVDKAQLFSNTYLYDSEQRRIRNTFTDQSGGNINYDVRVTKDAIGRDLTLSSQEVTVTRGYDANNNKRMTNATVVPTHVILDPTNVVALYDEVKTKASWAVTDECDRILLDDCILQNGQIVIDYGTPGESPGQGLQLAYTDNLRTQQSYVFNNKAFGGFLAYTDDGLLYQVTAISASTGLYVGTYNYSPNYEQLTYTQIDPTQVLYSCSNSTNDNGWLTLSDQLHTPHGGGDTNNTIDYTVGGFTADGQPLGQMTTYNLNPSEPKVWTYDEMVNVYLPLDQYALQSTTGYRFNYSAQSPLASVILLYDVNNHKNLVLGQQVDHTFDNGLGLTLLQQNHTGIVYNKVWQQGLNQGKLPWPGLLYSASYLWTQTQFLYDADDNIIASHQPQNPNYLPNTKVPLPSLSPITIVNYTIPVTDSTMPIGATFGPQTLVDKMGNPRQVFVLDRGTIPPSYPPPMPTYLNSAGGDTYASIPALYGLPPQTANVLALANNGSVADTLPTNQLIMIPPGVYNNYSTATSTTNYAQFMATMIGSLYPVFRTPQAPKNEHVLGEVIIAIAALAVAIAAPVVGQAVAGAIYGSAAVAATSVTTGVLVTEAIAAAAFVGLANTMIQRISVDMGWQPHFSLSQVISSTVVEGLTMGFLPPANTLTNMDWATISTLMQRAGAIAVTNQLLMVAAGHKFDFRAVLAQTLAALTNAKLTTALQDVTAATALSNILSSLEQWAIQRQAPDMTSLIVQVMGNIVADRLLSSTQSSAGNMMASNTTSSASNADSTSQQSSAARPSSAYANTDTGPGDAAWTTDSSPSAAQSNPGLNFDYATISNRAPKASSTTTQGYQAISEQPDLRYILDPHSTQAAATPPSLGKLLSDYLLFSPSGTLQADTQTTKLATTANQTATQTSKAQRWNGQVGNSSLANNDLVMLGPGLLVPRSDITIANTAIGDGASTIAMVVAPEAAASMIAKASLLLKDVPLVDKLYRFFAGGAEAGTESLSPVSQLNQALEQSKVYEQLETISANNPNASEALSSKLSRLERIQSTADKTETMPDGTVKYYDKFRAAQKSGSTVGSRFVTEFNPKTGDVTMWNEAYDSSGQVNRIHLKNINGIQIDSPHFPPTLQEILGQQATQTFLRPGYKP